MSQVADALAAAQFEDQTSLNWHDPQYPYPLNRSTVLHYFEFSPFFDRQCNNTLARRQNLDPSVPGVLESLGPGIEYVVDIDQSPNLLVIKKQLRKAHALSGNADNSSSTNCVTLALYYVLDKVVYQAPTLHAALTSRLKRCVWNIQDGFKSLQQDLDPLIRLLKDDKKRQAQKASLAAELASTTGDGEGGDVAKEGGEKVEEGGEKVEEAARKLVIPPAAKPMPFRKKITDDEAKQWKKTDNIVMTVLSNYPLPHMPAEYYNQGAAAQHAPPLAPEQAAAGADQPEAKRVKT